MQITGINRGTIYLQRTAFKQQPKTPAYNSVSFTSDCLNNVYPFMFSPLDKMKNFTVDEYNKLSDSDIEQIRNSPDNQENLIKFGEFLDEHAKISSLMKKMFDKEYGEGNYVVVSIGRSLASATKALGFKIGEDNVKLLPMSDARRFDSDYFKDNDDESLNVLNEYLKSINLSKEDIKTSGKQYILADFCYTGKSLNGAYKLLQSEKIWDNQPNIHKIDIIDEMLSFEKDEYTELGIDDKDYFVDEYDILLLGNTFKKFSPVNYCLTLSQTPKAMINPTSYPKEVQYFWFNILDNEFRNKRNQK